MARSLSDKLARVARFKTSSISLSRCSIADCVASFAVVISSIFFSRAALARSISSAVFVAKLAICENISKSAFQPASANVVRLKILKALESPASVIFKAVNALFAPLALTVAPSRLAPVFWIPMPAPVAVALSFKKVSARAAKADFATPVTLDVVRAATPKAVKAAPTANRPAALRPNVFTRSLLSSINPISADAIFVIASASPFISGPSASPKAMLAPSTALFSASKLPVNPDSISSRSSLAAPALAFRASLFWVRSGAAKSDTPAVAASVPNSP